MKCMACNWEGEPEGSCPFCGEASWAPSDAKTEKAEKPKKAAKAKVPSAQELLAAVTEPIK